MALGDWWRRRDRRAEARDEIEAHIRMAVRDRIDRGESPQDAERNARLEFGSVRLAVEDARAVWSWTTLEQLWMDVRTGARILTHAPGLSLTAVLLIALVIGGNTTIYSAVHGMLTKPAPGVRARDLVSLGWRVHSNGVIQAQSNVPLSYYTAIAEQSRLVQAAASRGEQVALSHASGTFAIRAASVSANYFATLGITPVQGRGFRPEDAKPSAAGLVAVISQQLWFRQFQGRHDIIGLDVLLDGEPATVIGVTGAPFQGVWLAEATDLWIPLGARPVIERHQRTGPVEVDAIFARKRPGAEVAAIQAELRAIAADVARAQPAGSPRHEPEVFGYSGVAGRDSLIAEYGPRFLSIFAVVTLLTVCIVCANVANLLLARAVSRQREMAVRQSFGASRWRITRLVLAENLVLAGVAWAIACVFAYWMSSILPGIVPPSESGGAEVLLDFTPDWNVFAYAMVLAVAAAAAFTIAPAMKTWRQDLLSFLKAGERGIVQGRVRATQSLVVVQIALSVVLLTAAGLAWRSLSIVRGAHLGFDTRNLLLLTVDTAAAARTPEADTALLKSMLGAVAGAPGIEAAGYAQQSLSQWWPDRPISASGSAQMEAERNEIGPGYLETLGVRLTRGQPLTHRRGARPEVIINQHLADALWPGQSPLDKVVRLDDGVDAIVAGVIPNALIGGYRRTERPFILLVPHAQSGRGGGFMTFYARYRATLENAVDAVTRAMREAAESVPVTYIRTMDATLHDLTWLERTLTTLLLLFAAGSLLIATLGQYAAMAFAMRQRVRDYAIRIAMGASAKRILTSALREGLVLTAAGLAIGVVLGSIAARAGASLLHGVTASDAMTYSGVLSVLAAASLAACYLPARRASRVDPIEALRAE